MGEFAKVVRWTAPGAVAILMAVMVVATGRWLLWRFDVAPSSGARPGSLITFAPGLVALIVAVTVPVGFLIYQIYFCLHSNVEGLVFQFVHKDVGLEALKSLSAAEVVTACAWEMYPRDGLYLRWPRGYHVPLTQTPTLWLRGVHSGVPLTYERSERRKALTEYARACEKNWLALETKISTRSTNDEKAGDRVFAALERLADIYHTLGATKIAIGVGWLVGLTWLYASATTTQSTHAWAALLALALGLAGLGFLSILMVVALHSNRRHCLRRRIAVMVDACNV